MRTFLSILLALISLISVSCKKYQDLTLAEIQELTASTDSKLIEQTQSKPYKGQEWQPGTVGGTWNTSILADPKTFNHLIAERDADSAAIIGMTTVYLVDYDMLTPNGFHMLPPLK